jgi:hypothetical protein
MNTLDDGNFTEISCDNLMIRLPKVWNANDDDDDGCIVLRERDECGMIDKG